MKIFNTHDLQTNTHHVRHQAHLSPVLIDGDNKQVLIDYETYLALINKKSNKTNALDDFMQAMTKLDEADLELIATASDEDISS